MQQLQLFEANSFDQRIETNSVKAIFTEIKKACFDVILEISSNKFLIKIREFAGKIEAFEIVAIKSFMELTQKTVALLRQITQHFFCRLDR